MSNDLKVTGTVAVLLGFALTIVMCIAVLIALFLITAKLRVALSILFFVSVLIVIICIVNSEQKRETTIKSPRASALRFLAPLVTAPYVAALPFLNACLSIFKTIGNLIPPALVFLARVFTGIYTAAVALLDFLKAGVEAIAQGMIGVTRGLGVVAGSALGFIWTVLRFIWSIMISPAVALANAFSDRIAASIALSLERSRRLVTKKLSHSNSFVAAVAIYVIRGKLYVFLILCVLAGVGAILHSSGWYVSLMLAAAMWYIFDISLIYYRIWSGYYGDTELEALEVISYLVRRRKSGKGGGPFSRIFEPLGQRSESEATVPGEVLGSRS